MKCKQIVTVGAGMVLGFVMASLGGGFWVGVIAGALITWLWQKRKNFGI